MRGGPSAPRAPAGRGGSSIVSGPAAIAAAAGGGGPQPPPQPQLLIPLHMTSSGDAESSPTLQAVAAAARARAERRASTSVLGNLQSVLDSAAANAVVSATGTQFGAAGAAAGGRPYAGAGAAGVLDYIADVHMMRDASGALISGAEADGSGGGGDAVVPRYGAGSRSRRSSLSPYGGTLTCLRNSIFASHFGGGVAGADSQGDFGGGVYDSSASHAIGYSGSYLPGAGVQAVQASPSPVPPQSHPSGGSMAQIPSRGNSSGNVVSETVGRHAGVGKGCGGVEGAKGCAVLALRPRGFSAGREVGKWGK